LQPPDAGAAVPDPPELAGTEDLLNRPFGFVDVAFFEREQRAGEPELAEVERIAERLRPTSTVLDMRARRRGVAAQQRGDEQRVPAIACTHAMFAKREPSVPSVPRAIVSADVRFPRATSTY